MVEKAFYDQVFLMKTNRCYSITMLEKQPVCNSRFLKVTNFNLMFHVNHLLDAKWKI